MTLSNRQFLLASLLCAALISVAFLPGVSGPFLLDDPSNIVDNPAVWMETLDGESVARAAFTPQPGGITRVLPMLTFALDYWRGGGADPAAFKATNILIHALTALLLAGFFRALLLTAATPPSRAPVMALALAAAWALHPLQVSSVLYVVQRMQTLSTVFLIAALWAYVNARVCQLEGRSGRTRLMLAGLLWLLAVGCKEDAVALPAYALCLELTVFRFAADKVDFARTLRRTYQLGAIAAAALYFLVVVPHYWQWDASAWRDFSTFERLLTQARVLAIYIGQIVVPLPSTMPFYYDWLAPSRGLLDPWTTLASILGHVVLLAVAWRVRKPRPLFALGIFLFYAGHFITSNVVSLELAYEHRNHFALVGAVLAVGDLLAVAYRQLKLRRGAAFTVSAVLLATLASATYARANAWGDRLELAMMSTKLAPGSSRAWNSLCLAYDDLGGGRRAGNPNLDKAIEACTNGTRLAPYSITATTNLMVLKTRRGTITEADWDRYLARLQHVKMSPENRQSIWVLVDNIRTGIALDQDKVVEALDLHAQRNTLNSGEYTALGYFLLGHTKHPDKAFEYFAQAMALSAIDDPLALETIEEMKSQGRADWAVRLERILQASHDPVQ